MQIVANFDSSTLSAPAGYKTAVAEAIAFVDAAFSTERNANLTVNLTFSWGSAGGAAASSYSSFVGASYASVILALKIVGAPDFLLFSNDPLPGSSLDMTTAEARQLGFNAAAASDATITLSSSASWSWDPSVVSAAGHYDAVTALIHEITEALGRTCGTVGNLLTTPLALARFSQPDVVDTTSVAGGYLSFNAGFDDLASMGQTGGDLGDFTLTNGDPFGYAEAGSTDAFSQTDFQEMGAVGYAANPNVHSGGGANITVASGQPNAAVLMNSNGSWDTVTFAAAGGSLSVWSDQASVVGSGVSIDFYAGANSSMNAVSLYGATVADTVTGSNGAVALYSDSANIVGGGNAVYLQGTGDRATLSATAGVWDTATGSNAALTLSGAEASVFGGDDRVTFAGSGDAVSFYNSNVNWETVTAGALPSGVAPDGVVLNAAQASVLGDDAVVYFNGSSANAVSFYNTGAVTVQVYGANGAVVLNDTRAAIQGGADIVYLSGTKSLDIATLSATGGAWDTVIGSNGTVNVENAQASIIGGGDSVNLDGSANDAVSLYKTLGVADAVSGSGGAVVFNNAQANLNGGALTLDFAAAFGLDSIAGFVSSDTLNFSKADWTSFAALTASGAIAQVGADTVVKLDAADAVTLTGVSAASLTAGNFRFS